MHLKAARRKGRRHLGGGGDQSHRCGVERPAARRLQTPIAAHAFNLAGEQSEAKRSTAGAMS